MYKLPETDILLFKGGTALRLIYGSPRFSEDLDFSLFRVEDYRKKTYVENVFTGVLAAIEKIGIKVDFSKKSGVTTEGYFGDASFRLYDYPPVGVTINISSRKGKTLSGEVDIIANDFIPTYNLLHLSQEKLVNEKIFGALLERKKVRDFYDLYFLLRKGMVNTTQKKRLAAVKEMIIADAKKVNFRSELAVFLPSNQQTIISDFPRALEDELKRQL